MRILGIDPALSVTGYGLIDCRRDGLALIEAGVIQTSAKQGTGERLAKIYHAAQKLINDTAPDTVVLEKLYVHYKHPTTAYILGQARGVICLASAEKNIPLAEYAATRVKKAVVGKGLASKHQVKMMIASVFNLKLASLPKYTDVSDALALAVAHSYIMKAKR